MSVKSKSVCFVCLCEVESNTFSASRDCEDDEDENGSEFGLYIKFIKFATNYLKIPSTTFKPFLSITNAKNGVQIFCQNCRKTVQNICNSYLELIQVQLRLSWKLGELEKLMENAQCSDPESKLVQELAHNLGIADAASVEKIRELLSVRCEHMSLKFQPQLVLSRYESLPASSSQIIKKEVKHLSVNSENDSCPPEEDDIFSNASTSPSSCSRMKYHVILMDNQIKMEDDSEFEPDADQEGDNQDFESSSDWSSAGEEDSKRSKKSGSNALKKGAAQTTFSCEVEGCLNEFKSHVELNSHLKTHSQEVLYCQVCGWGFIDANLLKLHELVHLKRTKVAGKRGNQILCPESNCVLRFATIASLQDHYNIRHGIALKRFKCKQCEHAATSSRALRVHVGFMHGSNIRPKRKGKQKQYPVKPGPRHCGPCGLQFGNRIALAQHRRRLHLKRVCEICNDVFTGTLELKKHVNQTHPVIPKRVEKVELKFPCSTCTKAFPTTAKLELHKKSSHGEKVLDCQFCHKMFRTKKQVRIHRTQMHNSKSCPHCGKTFKDKALIRHISKNHIEKAATDDGRHACPHCTLRYNLKIYMHRHIWNCHPDAPENLKCSTCGLKMEGGKEKAMKRHELAHQTEEERKLQRKVRVCHICGQEFLLLKDFNKHVSAHEEIE